MQIDILDSPFLAFGLEFRVTTKTIFILFYILHLSLCPSSAYLFCANCSCAHADAFEDKSLYIMMCWYRLSPVSLRLFSPWLMFFISREQKKHNFLWTLFELVNQIIGWVPSRVLTVTHKQRLLHLQHLRQYLLSKGTNRFTRKNLFFPFIYTPGGVLFQCLSLENRLS